MSGGRGEKFAQRSVRKLPSDPTTSQNGDPLQGSPLYMVTPPDPENDTKTPNIVQKLAKPEALDRRVQRKAGERKPTAAAKRPQERETSNIRL